MQADFLGTIPTALLAVVGLAAGTVGFALLIGRWIDAQSNTVVDAPRKPKKPSDKQER